MTKSPPVLIPRACHSERPLTFPVHGDKSYLFLLIDPEKEGLGIPPVTLHISNNEEKVLIDEARELINKLLMDSFNHSSMNVVVTSKIIDKIAEGLSTFNINGLLPGVFREEIEFNNAFSTRIFGAIMLTLVIIFIFVPENM